MDYSRITKQTARSILATLQEVGIRHRTRVRLGRNSIVDVFQTDRLQCELLRYTHRGEPVYCVKFSDKSE